MGDQQEHIVLTLTIQSATNRVTLTNSHNSLPQLHTCAAALIIARNVQQCINIQQNQQTLHTANTTHTYTHTHIMAYKPDNTAELENIYQLHNKTDVTLFH